MNIKTGKQRNVRHRETMRWDVERNVTTLSTTSTATASRQSVCPSVCQSVIHWRETGAKYTTWAPPSINTIIYNITQLILYNITQLIQPVNFIQLRFYTTSNTDSVNR